MAPFLLKEIPDLVYSGLDISKDMVKKARAVLVAKRLAVNKSTTFLTLTASLLLTSLLTWQAQKNHGKFSFHHGSFMTSPLADASQNSYDTVIFSAALQFFFDQRKALQRAAETLRPGGRIVVTHARGGDFVRLEALSNPRLASPLPSTEMLEHWIDCGDLPPMKLLYPNDLGSDER